MISNVSGKFIPFASIEASLSGIILIKAVFMLQNRKVNIVSFLLLGLTWTIGYSQSTWFTRINPTEWMEFSSEMIPAPDGGWLLSGTSEENVSSSGHGVKDIVIVKLDGEGEIQWTQRLDVIREGVSWDEINPNIMYEPDGSILVVAASHKNTNGLAGRVVFWKLSATGAILSHSFSDKQQYLNRVIRSASGDIITAGVGLKCLNDSCWDVKSLHFFNSQLEHQEFITGFALPNNLDIIHEAVEMEEVGITILGETYFFDTNNTSHRWLTLDCYDPVDQQYKHYTLHNLVGNAFSDEHLIKFDGQHVIACYEILNQDYWVEKRNVVTNQVIWKRSLSELIGFITDVGATSDGGLLIASVYQQTNITLIKLDANGEIEWDRILPVLVPLHPDTQQVTSHTAEITSIQQAADGGYVIFGQSIPDKAIGMHELFVLKLDHLGGFGNLVDGYLKIDSDDNCLLDSADVGLEGWIVEASNQQLRYVTTTDSTGYYAIQLPLGDFEITFSNTNQPYWALCPQNNIVQILNQGDSIRLDQPVQRVVHCPLMDVDVAAGWLNICNQAMFVVKYCNYGSVSGDDVRIAVVLHHDMSVISTSLPFTQQGDTLFFSPGDIAINDCGRIRINVYVSCSSQSGEFCVSAFITPDQYCLAGSPPPGINFSDVVCRQAGQPFDPNNKLAWPAGAGVLHKILADSMIEYQINFQNTGTDTAVHVVLRDTLSAHLDLSSFQPGASSHPYHWELIGNRMLKFTFANIDLPDSTTNTDASQGFVTYQVKPVADVDFGARIENDASIYFDYQPPIVTNMVFHTIAKPIHEGWIQETICYGEIFEGVLITEDTILADTLILEEYDSIRYFVIDVLPEVSMAIQALICPGEEYVFGGDVLYVTGLYTAAFNAVNGCDSTVELALQVVDTSLVTSQIDLCVGEISPITQLPYDVPGIYVEQFNGTNSIGCDSNVLLTIHVYPQEESIIEKEFPYGTVYHDITLTHDTIFVVFDTTEYGCPLTIYENILVTTTATLDYQYVGIHIFPNPMADEIQIELDVKLKDYFSFRLMEMQGRIVKQFDTVLTAGQHALHCPVSGLEPGMYVLQVKAGTKSRQFRLVKL